MAHKFIEKHFEKFSLQVKESVQSWSLWASLMFSAIQVKEKWGWVSELTLDWVAIPVVAPPFSEVSYRPPRRLFLSLLPFRKECNKSATLGD
jgi:hypothetical protein